MKKSLIVAACAVLAMAVVAGGCASAPKGPTDQESVAKAVADWKAAGLAKDLDKMMASYSEAFQHYEWGDKAGLKSFLKDAMDMGYLDNATINLDKAATKIEKDKATVYPVEMKASFGSATIELVLKKEAAKWAITGMTVEEN